MGVGRGAAGLALLALTASACGPAPPPEVDLLQAQLDLATADAELARAAAGAAAPPLAPALTQIALERTEHARVLAGEIARAAGLPAPTTTRASGASGTATSPAPTTTGAPPPPPKVTDVIAALRRSADSAGQLAASQSGYRAGLLGSIAASCTTSYTVSLNVPAAAS